MNTKLFVLYGGKSVEHDISLKTAFAVIRSIDPARFDVYPIYINRDGVWLSLGQLTKPPEEPDELILRAGHRDVIGSLGDILIRLFALEGRKAALPLLHGSYGEDGTMQGLLELLDIPYVGNGVLPSAACLDKDVCKQLISHAAIDQVDYRSFRFRQWEADPDGLIRTVEDAIGYPCYVKPASLGSSIGISRCDTREQLLDGVAEAFRFDRKIVVEKDADAREIQVAVLGNDAPLVSLPGEFIQEKAFFDFDAKYVDGKLRMSIPADLPESVSRQIRQNAVLAFEAVNGSGLARVDFFVTKDGRVLLNEINTFPGFTAFSMYPRMWESTDGTTFPELIDKLVDFAFARHMEKQSIRYER
ncbi:D-alanine--D-alanine ligase family protein [Cohnella faecalis]|uniref:D-alanine--D-alanine ligase family protein n=1 Tax=Cohnella faecalis TaxID=2315694 RepID=UPI00361FB292